MLTLIVSVRIQKIKAYAFIEAIGTIFERNFKINFDDKSVVISDRIIFMQNE